MTQLQIRKWPFSWSFQLIFLPTSKEKWFEEGDGGKENMSFILFLYWTDRSREPSHPITQEVLRFSWQLSQPLGSPNGILIAQFIPSVMLNDLNCPGKGLSSKMNVALLLQSKGFKRCYCISGIVGVRITVDIFLISRSRARGWISMSVQLVRVIGRGVPGKEVVIWSVPGTCNRSFPQFSLFMPPKHNTWSQMIQPRGLIGPLKLFQIVFPSKKTWTFLVLVRC